MPAAHDLFLFHFLSMVTHGKHLKVRGNVTESNPFITQTLQSNEKHAIYSFLETIKQQ